MLCSLNSIVCLFVAIFSEVGLLFGCLKFLWPHSGPPGVRGPKLIEPSEPQASSNYYAVPSVVLFFIGNDHDTILCIVSTSKHVKRLIASSLSRRCSLLGLVPVTESSPELISTQFRRTAVTNHVIRSVHLRLVPVVYHNTEIDRGQ